MFFRLLARSKSWMPLFVLAVFVARAQNKTAPIPPDLPAIACQPTVAFNLDGLRVFNGTTPVLMALHCGGKIAKPLHAMPSTWTLPNLTTTKATSSLPVLRRAVGPAPWSADGLVGFQLIV